MTTILDDIVMAKRPNWRPSGGMCLWRRWKNKSTLSRDP